MVINVERATRRLMDAGLDEGAANGVADVMAEATDGLATQASLDIGLAELRTAIAELRTEVKGDMARLETELKSDIKSDMARLETELRGEVARLEVAMAELASQMGVLVGEIGKLRGEMGELRGEMGELRGDMGKLEGRVSRMLWIQGIGIIAAGAGLITIVNAVT